MPYYIKKDDKYLSLSDMTTEHYDDDYNIVNESYSTGFSWIKDSEFAKHFTSEEAAKRYIYRYRRILKDVQVVREKN